MWVNDIPQNNGLSMRKDSLGRFFYTGRKVKSKKTEGCYIATMVYGDYNHPKVLQLRYFRDNCLKKYIFGLYFIKCFCVSV